MTLATRCPSCATVFRVVQDQLRVSDGWVRCGRCNGVFDATEVLFDIDSGEPVRLQQPPAAPPDEAGPAVEEPPPPPQPLPAWSDLPAPPALHTPRPEIQAPPPAGGPRFDPGMAGWPAPGPIEPSFDDGPPPAVLPLHPHREEPLLRAPSRPTDEGDEGDAGDADDEDDRADAHDRIVITDHQPGALSAAALPRLPIGRPDEPTLDPLAPAAGADRAADAPAAAQVQAPPSFMRSAAREARWQKPLVRIGLWACVLLLGLAALLQVALLWRDPLAAAWPAAKPALQALCGVAGCSVQPLRRIEALGVESSGLNRLDGSPLYRLQTVLRNRADTAVMMPALELALTDGQGVVVARRVLQPADLGLTQPVLQAGQVLPVSALVSTGDRRVDGYTLELFYP